MSDHQPLGLKGLFDIYQSTLRLVGAANATGAIAAGAAFHSLDKIPEAQSFIKYVVLVFLMGVLAFTISYTGLFVAQMEINSYLAARQTTERTEWEKILLGIIKDPPTKHLLEAKKTWIVMMLAGLLSFLLFVVGLALVLVFVVRL
jgi:allantoicase